MHRLKTLFQDVAGWLLFDKVARDDIGRYTCIAQNEQGTIDATIFVDVVGESLRISVVDTFVGSKSLLVPSQEIHC